MASVNRLNYLLQRDRNSLDFVRFIAAVGVILSHSFPLSLGSGYEHYDPTVWLTNSQTTTGGLAVAIFFVISGFLITASIEQSQSGWRYIRSRFLRIYPALIVVVLLTVFVLGPLTTTLTLGDYFRRAETYGYFRTLLLNDGYSLPGVFTTNVYANVINGSLWTLLGEILCYCLLLLLWITRLLKKRIILALFIGLLILNLGYSLLPDLVGVLGIQSRLLDILNAFFSTVIRSYCLVFPTFFLAGTLCYLYRSQIAMQRRYVALGLLFLLISIILKAGLYTLWFPVFGTYIVFYLASSQRSPFKRFSRYGDFSYGMYIYAFPVQQALTHFWGGTMEPPLNFVLATGVTLIFAVFSWHCVEKPALKLKHQPLGLSHSMPNPTTNKT